MMHDLRLKSKLQINNPMERVRGSSLTLKRNVMMEYGHVEDYFMKLRPRLLDNVLDPQLHAVNVNNSPV